MNWQILGFIEIKKFFTGVIASNQLSHAYLFSGQEMIGKRTFALELFEKIGSDFLLIDAGQSDSGQTIGIDEIKKIKRFLSFSSVGDKYKSVLINDAHLMTEEAQNALLKTLEEPSPQSLIVLISANPTSLLETIISRCQLIKFPVQSQAEVETALQTASLSETDCQFLSGFANGRIGLAIKIIQNHSLAEIKEAIDKLEKLRTQDIADRLAFAQSVSEDKNKSGLNKLILYWLLYTRTKLAEPKIVPLLRGLQDLHEVIGQPQYNARLAMERFLVNM